METLFVGLVFLSWIHLARVRGVRSGLFFSAFWAFVITGLQLAELWLTGPEMVPAFANHALVVMPVTMALCLLGYIIGGLVRSIGRGLRPERSSGGLVF